MIKIIVSRQKLFFYSGHGHSRGDKGFFRKAVAMNQVVTWAKNIESKHEKRQNWIVFKEKRLT